MDEALLWRYTRRCIRAVWPVYSGPAWRTMQRVYNLMAVTLGILRGQRFLDLNPTTQLVRRVQTVSAVRLRALHRIWSIATFCDTYRHNLKGGRLLPTASGWGFRRQIFL